MFLTIFLITVPFPLNISLVSASEVSTVENDSDFLLSYFYKKDDILYFDIDKAKRDSLSKDLIESAEFALKYESLSGNSEDIEKLIQSRGIPIYGNWCGPKYGSGKPKNKLDTGCMNHDKCYGKRGYFACSYDKDLIKYTGKNSGKMGKTEKKFAVGIVTYFKLAPCNPFA